MSAALAIPGNTADMFLVHFFGTGLADDRYVVQEHGRRRHPPLSRPGAGDGQGPVRGDDASTLPTLSVFDATGVEGANVQVTIQLSRPSDKPVTVLISSREATPVSAVAGDDFMVWTCRGRYGGVVFRPDQTETTRDFHIWSDAHDDGGETFEV